MASSLEIGSSRRSSFIKSRELGSRRISVVYVTHHLSRVSKLIRNDPLSFPNQHYATILLFIRHLHMPTIDPSRRSLANAIENLQDLMDEAVGLAAQSTQDSTAPAPWAPPRRKTATIGIADDCKPRRSWRTEHAETFPSKPHDVHFGRHARRDPIARKWESPRKRITATVACVNTGIPGFIVGIYAGMVPRIQYQLADQRHYIIQGNIYLYIGLAVTSFLFWPLPLLHGRRPYIIGSFALALPLQFPQAVICTGYRPPTDSQYHVGLLLARFFTGLSLGFAHVNSFTVLLDLFGASLMSSRPHQEFVALDDMRRDGGGMGLWLGLWSCSFIASLSVGFLSGAAIINHLSAEWGFYVTIILIASVLVLNIIAPETRRSAFRRSFREYIVDSDDNVRRKVGRGEVKLHISTTGPLIWWEEAWAGVILSKRMFFQWGFSVMALYVGWIYAQIVLIIVVCVAQRNVIGHNAKIYPAAWCSPISRLQDASNRDWRRRVVNCNWGGASHASFQSQSTQSRA